MALYTLADRAKSTVETLLLIGDDHVHVKAADYALYPATGIFLVTVCKRVGNVESNIERCICTSKTSPDILNITRGQFDTVAAEHEVGELVQYRVNKAMLANMISELQAEIDSDITAHVALPDPHAQYGLETGGVSMSFVANANLFSSVAAQDSALGMRGGLNAVGSGGFLQLYGKSHATYPGALRLATPNVAGDADLDPKKYGVIVESGGRRGLLLPDLEGVDTVAYQIEICRAKAGIPANAPLKLHRFEVKRYK